MTERPILFSAPMVRAILAGRKTQTRRVLKPQPDAVHGVVHGDRAVDLKADGKWKFRLPSHLPGDHLWVREAWCASSAHDDLAPSEIPPGDGIEYAADPERVLTGRNRAAIHMPRWASRITLEVTNVRIERLQAISEDDALAEGIEGIVPDGPMSQTDPVGWYRAVWDTINGPGAWDANPWVAALMFRMVT